MELGYKRPRERALRDSGLGEYTQMQLSKGKSRRTPDKPQKNGWSDGTGLGVDAKCYRPSDKEPFMNERGRPAGGSLAAGANNRPDSGSKTQWLMRCATGARAQKRLQSSR